jgi:uncharacterized membrane protein YiaA
MAKLESDSSVNVTQKCLLKAMPTWLGATLARRLRVAAMNGRLPRPEEWTNVGSFQQTQDWKLFVALAGAAIFSTGSFVATFLLFQRMHRTVTGVTLLTGFLLLMALWSARVRKETEGFWISLLVSTLFSPAITTTYLRLGRRRIHAHQWSLLLLAIPSALLMSVANVLFLSRYVGLIAAVFMVALWLFVVSLFANLYVKADEAASSPLRDLLEMITYAQKRAA